MMTKPAQMRRTLVIAADAPDRTVPVVGHRKGAAGHRRHINRTADICVVHDEACREGLGTGDAGVAVQIGDRDLDAFLDGAVPWTMLGDKDLPLVVVAEHVPLME